MLRDHLIYRCVSKAGTSYITAKEVKRDKSIIRVNLPDYLDAKVIDALVDKNSSFRRDKKYILNHVGDICWEVVPAIAEKGIRKFISKEQYDEIFKDSEEVRRDSPMFRRKSMEMGI